MKILNVGCGNEKYGTHFLDKYPSRDDIIKFDADVDTIPFPDDYFDIVYSKNLFEHLTNLNHFLKECYRVLKNRGKIVLITDNASYSPFYWRPKIASMVNRILALPYGVAGVHNQNYDGCGEDDRHYAVYTKAHLYHHLRKAGFIRISITEGFFTELFSKSRLRLILPISVLLFGYPRLRAEGIKYEY